MTIVEPNFYYRIDSKSEKNGHKKKGAFSLETNLTQEKKIFRISCCKKHALEKMFQPGVNFINIFLVHFFQYFGIKKLQSQTLLEKSCSICFCTKNARVKC